MNDMKIIWVHVAVLVAAGMATAADWPQLQRDGARIGRTSDSVAPPYRARWMWLGSGLTLQNQDSEPGWPHDLDTRPGYTYPLPASVPFTLSDEVQPIVVSNRVFVGTIEGQAWGIDAFGGLTLWTADLPGGTMCTAAAVSGRVVFACLDGTVRAFDQMTGLAQWVVTMHRTTTSAPCVVGTTVYTADHAGYAYAIDAATGAVLWESDRLGPSVQGGLAADGSSLYVCTEDMICHALNQSDGTERGQATVRGQSFRTLHPVVFNNLLYVHSAPVPAIGSEYVMDDLMAGSATLQAEEANIRLWLAGNDNGGAWEYVSQDWKHLHVLNTTTMTEPFVVAAGPVDGSSMSPRPVVVDNSNRVLTYFKTRFATLTTPGPIFGTNYTVDIAAIDQANGNRLRIDNGHFSGIWMWETDNLYAMSVAGDYLWLRQNFRGTQVINLSNSTYRYAQTSIRNYDGGLFNADIMYAESPTPAMDRGYDVVQTAHHPYEGRVAPVISGSYVYFSESFGIVCAEHQP
ncbi:MAG: PQQ-binding-like beta-propeller repeat protein [bacterium]|nr:PQQ-binding-like beta-propeller repeat protein [bacterium]